MGEQFASIGDADSPAVNDGFDVKEHWVDKVVVVAVSGTVDMLTAPRLAGAIATAAAKSPAAVIVDLRKVEFLASAGMSVLVAAHSDVTPTAGFGVIADGPATSRPITLVGLDSVFALYSTLDDALDAIAGA
jgi:anti-sigma B factor antagonist